MNIKNIFQKPYNWFKNLKSPKWYVDLTDKILKDVIIPSLEKIGKEQYERLVNLVKDAAAKDWKGTTKIGWVAEEFLKGVDIKDLAKSELNLIIEGIVSDLKSSGILP